MGKVNGQKIFRQKQYLLWTLNDLLNIANGCSTANVESNNTFVGNFDHKLSFRQLYEFIKQNLEYVFNRDIPHATYLCEICENAVYFMKGLNNLLPTNALDIVQRFSCDSTSEDCINSKCADCKSRTANESIGDRNWKESRHFRSINGSKLMAEFKKLQSVLVLKKLCPVLMITLRH